MKYIESNKQTRGSVGQPDGEGLGALLVGVLLLPRSLAVNFHSFLTQSLLNTFKPDIGSGCNHSYLRIPMERVGLPPLVKKGETVGETHGETILGEAGALQVLAETNG